MHGIRIGSEIGKRMNTIKSLFPSENNSRADVRQPSKEKPTAETKKMRSRVKRDDTSSLTLRKTVVDATRVLMINVSRIRQ
jgi:hypothetical protein